MSFRRASAKLKWDQARERNPALFDRLIAGAETGSHTVCWPWQRNRHPDGYGLLKSGSKTVRAHRVMFLLWYPNVDAPVVRHNCNNPCCINPAHLRAGTQKDNAEDRVLSNRGGYLKGTCNGRSKLTESDVLEIRASSVINAELARQYGVSKTVIGHIKKRISWKHI